MLISAKIDVDESGGNTFTLEKLECREAVGMLVESLKPDIGKAGGLGVPVSQFAEGVEKRLADERTPTGLFGSGAASTHLGQVCLCFYE